MRSSRSTGLAVLLIVPVWTAAVSRVTIYADGPPVGHTGGFEEPSCHECHSDNPVDDAAIHVEISGVPDRYVPESPYELEVLVSHPDMGAAGFQLSARYADGPEAGQQAGKLEAFDESVTVVTSSSQIFYASHSEPVARAPAWWRLKWTAPLPRSTVVFHLAANAANDDDSEFGDHVGLASVLSMPVKGQGKAAE